MNNGTDFSVECASIHANEEIGQAGIGISLRKLSTKTFYENGSLDFYKPYRLLITQNISQAIIATRSLTKRKT